MRKLFKLLGFVAILATIALAMSSFTNSGNDSSNRSCKVTVKYQNGDPAESVTVTAFYKSGGYHDFKTNDDGVVYLEWYSEYDVIKHVYVKGNKYEVSYSEGGSYTLYLKQKHKYD